METPIEPSFEVTGENFETEVLQASLEQPVLIDFWAEWCGPCKALGPVLDKLANEYQGRLRLGKINVDEQQELAAAFGIRSIPTVMLVKDGKPVDGFAGALPEGQIREFLDRHLPAAEDTDEAPGTADGSDAGNTDESDAAQPAAELPGQEQRQAMAAELEGAPTLEALQQRIQTNAEDWEARDLLGLRLLLGQDAEAGLEQFLYLLEHARHWADGRARQRLLDAFVMLDDSALVAASRRRMASLLF